MRSTPGQLATKVILIAALAISAATSARAQDARSTSLTSAQDAKVVVQQAAPTASVAASEGFDKKTKNSKRRATVAGESDFEKRPSRAENASAGTSQAIRIVVGLTALAILPALLICLTAFLRIIIVLSMLRHAIGMPETPPNTVLLGLALFLTLFSMSPVLHQVNQDALQPFIAGKLGAEAAYDKGSGPMREFMVRQTREQDLALTVELSKAPRPESMEDISNVQLIPAFMLSELRSAFQIGFVIFLPFLLIDLIVSSVLMALGMMMMPPTSVALPLKILMFILVDGWSVVLKALMGSFH